jgi:protein TonB
MLSTLLESRSRRERSAGQLLLSVAAHTAIIGAALYATASAGAKANAARPVDLRLVYTEPSRKSLTAASPTPRKKTGSSPSRTLSAITRIIPIEIPAIGASLPSFDSSALTGTALADLPHGNVLREPTPAYGGEALRAEQVEKQAAVAPGNSPPRYPEVLRASGVEGHVVAAFIISTEGRYEEGSLRFVRSDNPLFERAVQTALLRMRFVPAEIGGRRVRQLVEMPFVFTLQR